LSRRGFSKDFFMWNADSSAKTSLNCGIQVLPDAYQISFCLLPIAFSSELSTPI
jgi:hypothetical protein